MSRRLLALAVAAALFPAPVAAQALRPLDSFDEGESPEADVRDALAAEVSFSGAAADPIAEALMTQPDVAFVVQDFCQGCQRAHLWLVNASEAPVWSVEVPVTLRHSRTGESTSYTMFLPAMPARSAARMSFRIPWEVRERVWVRLGDLPPAPGMIFVDYPGSVEGTPLSASVVEALRRRRTNYSALDGQVQAGRDSVSFVLDHVTGPALTEFALLLAAAEGGDERVRGAALANLGRESGPALFDALPEEALPELLDDAVRRPGALGGLLARVDEPMFAALSAQLAERPTEERRAFAYAAMQAEDEARRVAAAASVPDDQREHALRVGWRALRDDDPLLPARLAWLRSLETDGESRAGALATIERRRLDHGWRVPDAAAADVTRLRRAAPDTLRDVYRAELEDLNPFTVDVLVGAGLDLRAYHEDVRPTLRGCGDPREAEDLARCADSLQAHPRLAALAAEHGVREELLSRARALLRDEDDPARAAELARRWSAWGLAPAEVATDLCDRTHALLPEDRPAYVDAARALDPHAACVVAADAEILGLAPGTLALVAGIFLLVLLGGGAGLWLGLRYAAARREAMQRILDE